MKLINYIAFEGRIRNSMHELHEHQSIILIKMSKIYINICILYMHINIYVNIIHSFCETESLYKYTVLKAKLRGNFLFCVLGFIQFTLFVYKSSIIVVEKCSKKPLDSAEKYATRPLS